MRRQIRAYDEQVRKRYVASKRHTIQVDFRAYLNELARERRASRARAGGGAPGRGAALRRRLSRSAAR
jgi:hypothetical protein